jgi:hypothetical protein
MVECVRKISWIGFIGFKPKSIIIATDPPSLKDKLATSLKELRRDMIARQAPTSDQYSVTSY